MKSLQISLFCLFFSLPLIALLKGKGIAILFFVLSALISLPFLKKILQEKIHLPKLDFLKKPGTTLFIFFVFFELSRSILFYPMAVGSFLKLILLGCWSVFSFYALSQTDLRKKRMIRTSFFFGFLLYMAFYMLEIYGGSPVSFLCLHLKKGFDIERYVRGTVILAFLFWPFIISLKTIASKKWFPVFLPMVFMGMVAILLKARPDAALLALVSSSLTFCLARRWKRTGFFLGCLTVLAAWTAPFVFKQFVLHDYLESLYALKTSYQHRLQMWHALGELILQKPFLGYGFEASHHFKDTLKLCLAHPHNVAFLKDPQVVSIEPFSWGNWVCYTEALLGTHPHNGFLQIWLDFGAFGISLFSLGLFYIVKKIDAIENPFVRAVGIAVFTSYLCIWSFSFGIWQVWMLCVILLTVFLIISIRDVLERKEK